MFETNMSISLVWLAWTLFLALIHIFLTAVARRRQDGLQWAAGNRDGEVPQYTGVAARLGRAQANLFETLPIFAGAVLIAHVTGREGALVAWGSTIYFWGRVIYVPAYAYGWGPVRPLIWGASIIGLLLVFLGLV